MSCKASELIHILKPLQYNLPLPEENIEFLLYDSRKIFAGHNSVFFALKTNQNDGKNYLEQTALKGVKNWIVNNKDFDYALKLSSNQINVFAVQNTLHALQQLAIWKRNHFHKDIIGITGSNGKTIVKEWLGQMLAPYFKLVKSPKSYNSQLGVPLSVWQLEKHHELGIFEAGISEEGEMKNLEAIIKPTYGIFTNIGTAHDDGFSSREKKICEKLILFKNTKKLIISKDHTQLYDIALSYLGKDKLLSWSTKLTDADIFVQTDRENHKTNIRLKWNNQEKQFQVPFIDHASIENVLHCIIMAIFLQIPDDGIARSLETLKNLEMRLELKHGINGCYLIDDTYNNDLQGLMVALEFMSQQSFGLPKTLILSEFLSKKTESSQKIIDILQRFDIKKLIWVGRENSFKNLKPHLAYHFFPNTETLLNEIKKGNLTFNNELILIKGARSFFFEKVVNALESKSHRTVLEINLNKLISNFKFFKSKLSPHVKIMAMVKAAAYGSGLTEIAYALQNQSVDYLGVAYVDEGIELRKNGIKIPIMVMNAASEQADLCIHYNLEPAIHGFKEWYAFLALSSKYQSKIPIHLAIDTGMHRLGFDIQNLEEIIQFALTYKNNFLIKSIFSHLVASDDSTFDAFTNLQIIRYNHFVNKFREKTQLSFLRHICNSAGILRFPEAHFDMVRLGIGLYGIDPTYNSQYMKDLFPILCLKTYVCQVATVSKQETIGYSRKGILTRDSKIATLAIGYGDGYPRKLGNGKGYVQLKGQLAPIVGNICMDLMMVDVTDIEGVEEGDEAIILGDSPSIYDIAKWLDTIPYEVLTSVGNRVKRIFFDV